MSNLVPRKCFPAGKTRDIRELVERSANLFSDRPAFQELGPGGEVCGYSFSQLRADVAALGTALLARGLAGKHLALVGNSSYAYVVSYLATVSIGAVIIPIDRELTIDELVALVAKSDAEVLLFSDCVRERLSEVEARCPRIDLVVCTDLYREQPGGVSLPALLSEGRALIAAGDRSYAQTVVDPDAVCAILFTSGTTGPNKGVMLSQRNITTVIHGAFSLFTFPEKSISVLPIHHAYEFNLHVLGSIYGGVTLCFNDSLMRVSKNLQLFAPQMSLMVPMIVEALHKNIWRQAAKNHLDKHLRYGLWYSNLIRRFGFDYRRLFFKPIHKELGGQFRMVVCGAAPLNAQLERAMSDLGIEVYNGYGITECAPLVAANSPLRRVPGSVGIPIPGIEVRIDHPDEQGNGEIQVRGDNVMLGYYKDPDATARVFTPDGWFRTGDVGHIGRRGALFVTGREKNLIILPNGKNVQPEELEELLHQHIDYLAEVVVHAGHNKANSEIIVASGYLEPEYVAEVGPDAAQARFREDVARVNKKIVSYKRIQDVVVCRDEFQKTSTRKIKRHTYSGDQK